MNRKRTPKPDLQLLQGGLEKLCKEIVEAFLAGDESRFEKLQSELRRSAEEAIRRRKQMRDP